MVCLMSIARTEYITRYMAQSSSARKIDQSQHSIQTHEQNQTNHSLKTTTLQNSIDSIQTKNELRIPKWTKLTG